MQRRRLLGLAEQAVARLEDVLVVVDLVLRLELGDIVLEVYVALADLRVKRLHALPIRLISVVHPIEQLAAEHTRFAWLDRLRCPLLLDLGDRRRKQLAKLT